MDKSINKSTEVLLNAGKGVLEVNAEKITGTCPSATLSTTNSTWTDPGMNLGLCGERPVTKHLSHGTASDQI
jgi:hypothetical protein